MPVSEDSTAILFPGQGVGDPSSRELVAELTPGLLALARELIGDDPFERIADGTRYAQPAVYCASIAGYELLGRPGARYFAGHSLGEVGALAGSGAIDEEDGLRIVVARGRLMEEAAAAAPRGAMLAVGTDRRGAAALARAHGLTLANENSPRQFVLSGPAGAVEEASADAKRGGTRAKQLAVAGAFHTEAMEAAAEPFRAELEGIEFREVTTPAISCSTAQFLGGDAREALVSSLTMPVRWVDVVRRLRDEGASRFVDVGPGKVLAGLVRKTLGDVEVEIVPRRESVVA